MKTIELKATLVQQISQIDDKEFLEAVKTIVNTKASGSAYQTNAVQRKLIAKAQKQIRNGEFTENDALNKEIDQWLSGKK